MVFERSKQLRLLIEPHHLTIRAVVQYEAKLIVIWRINDLIQANETLMHDLFHNLNFTQGLVVLSPHC
jgi:hypothetical protein